MSPVKSIRQPRDARRKPARIRLFPKHALYIRERTVAINRSAGHSLREETCHA